MAQRNPVCSKCKVTSSLMWHKTSNGSIMCLECQTAEKKASSSSPQSTRSTSVVSDTTPSQIDKTSLAQSPGPTTRRSTRSRDKANKAKQQTQNDNPSSNTVTPGNNTITTPKELPSITAQSSNGNKETTKTDNHKTPTKDPVQTGPGMSAANTFKHHHINQWQRGRRSLSLKLYQPAKSPISQPDIVTSDSICHNGAKYEVGDIVSLLDEDGGVFYALVRGFLQDHHAEKYAVITWLLPRYPNPTHFDPSQFILGPEEDTPKSLDVLEFVCHSPQSKNFQASYFHNYEQAVLWSPST